MTAKPDDTEIMPLKGDQRRPPASPSQPGRRGGYQREGIGEAMAKSLIRSIAASLGRILVRALTGRTR